MGAWREPCSVTSAIMKAVAGSLSHLWFSRGLQKATGQPLTHWLLLEAFKTLPFAALTLTLTNTKENKKKSWVCILWPCLSYFQQRYMMQHFNFYFPSHGDSWPTGCSEMHSREERKGGGEGGEACLLLSYILLKSVPDHLAAHCETSYIDTTPKTVQETTLTSTMLYEEHS